MQRVLATTVSCLALACAACAVNTAPEPVSSLAAESETQAATEAGAVRHADATKLTQLTRIFIDASSLYEAAAEDSSNETYSQTLLELSAERRRMADGFQQHLQTIGARPPELRQALGSAHREFMEARTLGDEDTKVAVQEALRGETYLEEQLVEAAGDTTLSNDARVLVRAQLPGVRGGKARLEAYAATLEDDS
jgi:uncharacterized protein (TIGR02284 family)